MRTFSALKALCAHPAEIDRPSKRRDEAAELGTEFHALVEGWVKAVNAGQMFSWATSDPVKGWFYRLTASWTPPPGCEAEVALGLADEPEPRYVPVAEPEPHEYVPVNPAERLLTAGRADLIWPVAGNLLHVVDLKTTTSYLGHPNSIRQITAQGIAATCRANAEGYRPGVYYARLGIFDMGRPVLRGSDDWDQAWAEVQESAKMSSEPRPGAWCLGCYSKSYCAANPAREAA